MKSITMNEESSIYLLKSHIGNDKWSFSDEIYTNLTGIRLNSNYAPKIEICIKLIPNLIPKKEVYGFFWSTPSFKDVDCNYLFRVFDQSDADYVISTSSGNTVEGLARAVKRYNETTKKNIKAILLVPDISSYKVATSAIESNPYVKYVVLKNGTLDSTRVFATKL